MFDRWWFVILFGMSAFSFQLIWISFYFQFDYMTVYKMMVFTI